MDSIGNNNYNLFGIDINNTELDKNEKVKKFNKDIDENISTEVVDRIPITMDIREIDVYMMVKYFVCLLLSQDKKVDKIMDELKNLTPKMIRQALHTLVIKDGASFKLPEAINKIPSGFNMFISDTTSRIKDEMILENLMRAQSMNCNQNT